MTILKWWISDSIEVWSSCARRQHDLAVVGDPRLALHVLEAVEALLDDAHRLAHLLHVHAVARVDVAFREDGHAEVDLVVGEVRLDLAQVPVDARPAQHRAGLAERDRVVGREQPEPLGALEPDLVPREQRLVVVDGAAASSRRTCAPRDRSRAGCPRRGRRPGSTACACGSRRRARTGRGSAPARGTRTRTSRSRPARAPRCRARRGASGCGSARRSSVRIQVAFGGISRSSSFSTAPTKTYSLFWIRDVVDALAGT